MLSKDRRQGYFTNDAIVVATESRTSSPVRITRNEKTLHHVQIKNLYPCGEGAGYAGGTTDAATGRATAVVAGRELDRGVVSRPTFRGPWRPTRPMPRRR